MNEGFVTLQRRILDWEWYDNLPTKVLFIHCLLKANHKDNNWRGVFIKRGQFVTSTNTLANETGLTIKQVRTALKNLEKTKELGKVSTSLSTLISVINYDTYQTEGKVRASQGQGKGKVRATNNNDNNDNNENNNNIETPKVASIDFDLLLVFYNKVFKKKTTIISDATRKKYNSILKQGYTKDNISRAMVACAKDTFHIENNYKYCSLDYFTRVKTIDMHGFEAPTVKPVNIGVTMAELNNPNLDV